MLAQTAGITILHDWAQLSIVTHQNLAHNVTTCSNMQRLTPSEHVATLCTALLKVKGQRVWQGLERISPQQLLLGVSPLARAMCRIRPPPPAAALCSPQQIITIRTTTQAAPASFCNSCGIQPRRQEQLVARRMLQPAITDPDATSALSTCKKPATNRCDSPAKIGTMSGHGRSESEIRWMKSCQRDFETQMPELLVVLPSMKSCKISVECIGNEDRAHAASRGPLAQFRTPGSALTHFSLAVKGCCLLL